MNQDQLLPSASFSGRQTQTQFDLQSKSISQSEKPSRSLLDFRQQFRQECVEGSAIAPELYAETIRIVSDIEVRPGGEVSYPIHEALNWHVTRFGQQARDNFYAALLLNEDGSTWQAKLSKPRVDKSKTLKALRQQLNRQVHDREFSLLVQQYPDAVVYQKYETTVGNGARAFLPPVPPEIRRRIGDRYGVEVPLKDSFWDWLAAHPEIPIVWTEGGKKALALLSQGYVAIALYGINGGYRSKDALGNPIAPQLIPEVSRFCQAGRQHILAFDQDIKISTRRRVTASLLRFSHLIAAAGSTVLIAQWDGSEGQCKGVDDLIVHRGAVAWETAYTNALTLEHFRISIRLESRLTTLAKLRIKTVDLSTLNPEQLPDQGLVAIASAKATGKTKLIARLVQASERVLAAGHRVALMRNLSSRLGLDYRGDLDKVKGQFINGSAYTLRVGTCVDALLSIVPEQFAGCDLIIDEVVQVLRHLLTSSTCSKDGKRPALLARFRELVQAAQRVIVADADLSTDVLHYLQELRDSPQPLFLVHNDYQPTGYPTRFFDCSDKGAITLEVLEAVDQLDPGKVLYLATDSKTFSRTIARMIERQRPDIRILLINADTSSGDCEQDFMQFPDRVLERGEYDVVITSPSVATGVSIESQGIISQVFGIFTGASSTDADMAQALGRVREPVERIVWCAERGSNYSKVSRTTNPLQLKQQLLDQTSTTISLIRSSLKEDIAEVVSHYDWRADPHIHLFAQLSAQQNFSMQHLRDALLVRLRFEGNAVTLEQHDSEPIMKLLVSDVRNELRQADATAIVAAPILSHAEVLLLEQRESEQRQPLTPEERRSLSRYYLCDFYGLEPRLLTEEFVLWDNEGRRRQELLGLEAQVQPDLALDRSVRSLERQLRWNQGLCPWDLSHAQLKRELRNKIGLGDLIQLMVSGSEWIEADLKPYADAARQMASAIKSGLNFTIKPKPESDEAFNRKAHMSDVQVIHQLLSQMGIKVSFRWSRSVEGHEGEKLRVYQLDLEHWQQLQSILDRRKEKRESLGQKGIEQQDGSPQSLNTKDLEGDPTPSQGAAPERAYRSNSEALFLHSAIDSSNLNSGDCLDT